MSRLRLGLLGGFEITADGEPLTIAMRKAKALLAWLALRPGETHSRERLAGLLWGESGEAQARHSLRQALSVLRRSLPNAGSLLRAEGDAVILVPEGIASDVTELRSLADSGDARDLERAAALYRGELLEGFSGRSAEFEDWMLAERSTLREEISSVLERLLAHFRGQSAWEPALRVALRLLALDPLRESVHRDLMKLQLHLGRPAEALRQYRTCQALLRRELGIAPEAATQELYRRVLEKRRQPHAAGSEPALPAEPADEAPSSLPYYDEGLLGRETELRMLTGFVDACLEAGAGSSVLVRGEAGIGKTRLAEAATELAAVRGFRVHRIILLDTAYEGSDRIVADMIRWLLDLEDRAEADELRVAVASACKSPDDRLALLQALDVALTGAEDRFYRALDWPARQSGRRRAIGRLLGFASARQPRFLLVEDIHWATPGLLDLLADLSTEVASAPALMLLTSRSEGEPLDPAWRGAMQGAPLTTLDLAPLRVETSREIALSAGPEDRDWIESCVKRSGGNPLFLEHLLRAGPEIGDKVPASLQGLIERRLARLGAEDRRTAQAAAVLGQRFSAEALGAVLGGLRDPCRGLCEARLLSRESEGYRFIHVLIRDGIRQTMPDTARRALHRRAAEWYADRDPLLFAEHSEKAEDPKAALAWLTAARACLIGHRYDEALSYGERAWRLSRRFGRIGDASWDDGSSQSEAGLFLASLQRELGKIQAAGRVLETVIAGCGDERILCDARIELAAVLLVKDDYAGALVNLDAATPAAEIWGGEGRLARLFYHRGNAFFPLGRLDECMAAHKAALDHARRAADPELEARALSGLADAHYSRGRMVTAHHYYDRCVRLCETQDLVRVQAPNLAGLAMSALYLNRISEAKRDAAAAVELASLTRSRRDECLGRNVLSIAAYYAGDSECLERECEQGLAIARAIGLRRFEADHLCMRGVARAVAGRQKKGLADLRTSLELTRDQDMAYGGAWVLGFLALLVTDSRLRRSYLAEGETALRADSLAHNHLQFRQCALEIALDERSREAVEHHARALEVYCRDEPLPWCDFYIARARTLMDWYQGRRDEGLLRRMRALEAEARQAGLVPAAEALCRDLRIG